MKDQRTPIPEPQLPADVPAGDVVGVALVLHAVRLPRWLSSDPFLHGTFQPDTEAEAFESFRIFLENAQPGQVVEFRPPHQLCMSRRLGDQALVRIRIYQEQVKIGRFDLHLHREDGHRMGEVLQLSDGRFDLDLEVAYVYEQDATDEQDDEETR